MTTDRAEIDHLIERQEERTNLRSNFVRLLLKDSTTRSGLVIGGRAVNSGGAPWTYGAELTLNVGGRVDDYSFVSGGQIETFDLLDVARIESIDDDRP